MNLTGVPSMAVGDLGLAAQNELQLSDADKLARKKKLMSAAMGDQLLSATQFLTGAGTGLPAGSVRAALGMPF
jgi:hypothetical protein